MQDDYLQQNTALKEQLAQLLEQAEEFKARTTELEAKTTELEKKNQELEADKKDLQEQIDLLKKQIFGRRSERYRIEHPGQQLLFEDELTQEAIREIEQSLKDATEEKVVSRRKVRRGPKPLPKHLPRDDRLVDLGEDEKQCVHGYALVKKREKVIEELEYIPASMRVIRHIQVIYTTPDCPFPECCSERAAPLPPRPIEEGRPGTGLLAHVVVSKYGDHIPLYRQSQIFAREGIDLARSTLCDWTMRVGELLKPIVMESKRQLLAGDFLQADETTIRTLRVKNRGRPPDKSHLAYLWGYGVPWEEVVYDYTLDRSKKNPLKFLDGFKGTLQIDGYDGYNGVFVDGEVQRVGCFAHARRKFHHALKDSPEEARTALAAIQLLYRLEREMKEKNLSPRERVVERRRVAKPVLEKLENLLRVYQNGCRPTSKLGKAIRYALNEWKYLKTYIEVGKAEIDNNSLEQTLRPVALGRKNYLFCGAPSGGQAAATLYSLVTSCKRLGVNPWQYIKDVLDRISTHPASRIAELTPKGWKAARLTESTGN